MTIVNDVCNDRDLGLFRWTLPSGAFLNQSGIHRSFYRTFSKRLNFQLVFHQSHTRLSTAFQYINSAISSFAWCSFLAISLYGWDLGYFLKKLAFADTTGKEIIHRSILLFWIFKLPLPPFFNQLLAIYQTSSCTLLQIWIKRQTRLNYWTFIYDTTTSHHPTITIYGSLFKF